VGRLRRLVSDPLRRAAARARGGRLTGVINSSVRR
jgi:hypothetical protein